MPWSTPALRDVRVMVRDNLRATLPGSDASVPNSLLRVLCDAMGALCHLTLQYIDWLALQLLPDTAEQIWLDRHGRIWLQNSDGSTGRKLATFATGQVGITGSVGVVVPAGQQLTSGGALAYETLTEIVIGPPQSVAPIRALDPGAAGNLGDGSQLSFVTPLSGVNSPALVIGDMIGGTDTETDDELRARVLLRIQQPPMGGDKTDYEEWALAVPGVTRAWCAPLEQGMGTVTIRFMMDDLRSDGLPNDQDVATVQAYIDSKRPVAVKDCFVVAPLPFPLNFYISDLTPDTESTRASISENLQQMFFDRSYPGGTIYRSWVDAAISDAIGEAHHELTYTTTAMPAPGYLPTLGSIIYYSTSLSP